MVNKMKTGIQIGKKRKLNGKGQEEMVGFALIVIIVAVILVVFLGFSLRRSSQKESVESYEAESFLGSVLQYTTDCRSNLEYLSVQKLIFECNRGNKCSDDRNTCDVLNSTLKGILDESWDVGEESPIKGYELNITLGAEEGGEILMIKKGNITADSKGSSQEFVRGGDTFGVIFVVYY